MNVLLCNDDGIDSKALKVLAEKLAQKNNVLVVAPKKNRSAISHSLTVFGSIKAKSTNKIKNCRAFYIDGTPADCVKFAIHNIKDFNIDVVVAGINVGHNLGADILYSGTVAIGYEAAFYGKKAFCFSTLSFNEGDYFGFSEYAEKIINYYYDKINVGTIINVNFPEREAKDIKGIKVSPLAKIVYEDEYAKKGNKYTIKSRLTERIDKGSDLYNVLNGYVSVTPLKYDKTDYAVIKELIT